MEHIQFWHFLMKKILKYFSDFENQNFSVLWLKWTQVMEMKQHQAFSHGAYSIWYHIFFIKKY